MTTQCSVESFRTQLTSGYDGLDDWVRTNVLYNAFESRSVDIAQDETVFVEPKTIVPSRFEDSISYRVRRPTALDPNKYLVDVRAEYETVGQTRSPDRALPKSPSNRTPVDVCVLFRSTVLVDTYGVRNDPEVTVVAIDG